MTLPGYNFQAIMDVISATGLLLSIIGGTFALLQWRQNTALKRAEITKQIVDMLRYDKEMAKMTYDVEYDRFKYTHGFHEDTELGQKVDGLLSVLDYACYLRSNGALHKNEFTVLEYRIVRIASRYDIQAYLWNLHQAASRNPVRNEASGGGIHFRRCLRD